MRPPVRSFLMVLLTVAAVQDGRGQEAPRRILRQGAVSGVKLFTDGRTSVNAYLGIPYAAAPVGPLRFAPPERHGGWNGSRLARAFASPCSQPRPEASAPGDGAGSDHGGPVSMQLSDEDCLYLNVWTPDNSNQVSRRGAQLPVMVFLEGESFVYGAPSRFPAMQELSARGLVVVSVNYRLNVFGFLCFGEATARGNLGLLDQYVALRWVQENAPAFGGDAGRVTLVGHSAGAASTFFHLFSPKTKGLFQSAVLMSGSGLAPWALSRSTFAPEAPHAAGRGRGAASPTPEAASAAVLASRVIARSLGCTSSFPKSESSQYHPDEGLARPAAVREMLACLRAKTTEELLRAFHAQYKSGNGSTSLLPVVDSFLPSPEQYFPRDPLPCVLQREIASLSEWEETACFQGFAKLDIPVMTGVVSHDGVVNLYGRGESLAREGYSQLKRFFETSAIPAAVAQYGAAPLRGPRKSRGTPADSDEYALPLVVQEALRFEYVERSPPGDTEALLSQLIEFYTDSQFRSPHERQLRFLSMTSARPLYAYVLEGTSYGGGFGSGGVPPAAGGGGINVSGAGHGSDLVLLFGSQAMQRASGRRFSAAEERLSDAIQRLWLEFMRQGNPTPNAYGYGPQWRQYSVGGAGDGGTATPHGYMSLERQQMRASAGEGHSTGSGHDLGRRISLWNSFLPRISRALRTPRVPESPGPEDSLTEYEDASQPYRSLTYALSGITGVLTLALLMCLIFLKRRRSRRRRPPSPSAGDPLGEGDLGDVEAVAPSSNVVSVVRGSGIRPSSAPRRCLPPGPAAASLASLNSLSSGKYSVGAWRYHLSANQL